jgi:hypothetical protein
MKRSPKNIKLVNEMVHEAQTQFNLAATYADEIGLRIEVRVEFAPSAQDPQRAVPQLHTEVLGGDS